MPYKIVNPADSRAYTCAVLEMLDNGELDKDQLIQDLLGWMSEDEVRQFCQRNLRDDENECIIGTEDDEDEEDPLDDFNYVGSRHHY